MEQRGPTLLTTLARLFYITKHKEHKEEKKGWSERQRLRGKQKGGRRQGCHWGGPAWEPVLLSLSISEDLVLLVWVVG